MHSFLRVIPLSFLGLMLLALAPPTPAAERQSTTERAAGERGGKGDQRYSDRERKGAWDQGKQQLEQALKPGQGRDFYRQQLEKQGFQITAVNHDEPDYLEYEVVKGDQDYEVQIDVKGGKAEKVNVTTNMWKAETTEQVLEGKKGDSRQAAARGNGRFSDRDRMSNWEQGKKQLEQALKPGQEKNAYRQHIAKLGFKVTSVNTDKDDYVEYEVVKDTDSYEVQIDLQNGKGEKVEIATNMWKADSTRQALRAAEGQRAGAGQERGTSERAGRSGGDQTASGEVRGQAQTSRTERESSAQGMGSARMESGRSGEQAASGEVRGQARIERESGASGQTGMSGQVRMGGEQAGSAEIRQAQQALKEKGHDPGPIDGVMGPQTQQALRDFQQANNIQATGQLNAETKEKLGLKNGAAMGRSETQSQGSRTQRESSAQGMGSSRTESGRSGDQTASGEVRGQARTSGMERESGASGQAGTSGQAGMRGGEQAGSAEIRQAQQALKEKGHDPGPIDGVMGPQTQQALRDFQQANNIQATGQLDAETKSRLGLGGEIGWDKTQQEGSRTEQRD